MATPSKAAQLQRWMKETGRGYKAAGKHFDIHPDEVRRLLGTAPRARARTRKTTNGTAASVADMGEEEYYRAQIEQLHTDMEAMRAKGSYQALVAAGRQAKEFREKLDELRKEREANSFDPNETDDIVRELLQLPDAVWAHPDVQSKLERRIN